MEGRRRGTQLRLRSFVRTSRSASLRPFRPIHELQAEPGARAEFPGPTKRLHILVALLDI
ncbi:hypothetical protein BDN70DRAFT_882998, partial [Pholiota conissans]